MKTFESLSLQNIRTIDDPTETDRQIHSANELTSRSFNWSNRGNSRSIDNLTSSQSCYEFDQFLSRSHKNKRNNKENFRYLSFHEDSNLLHNRLFDKVQVQIQRLESNKSTSDQFHSSPRKLPHTLPQQEANVMQIKKIFENETIPCNVLASSDINNTINITEASEINNTVNITETSEINNTVNITEAIDSNINLNNFNNNNNNNIDDILTTNNNNQLMDLDDYNEKYGCLMNTDDFLIFGDLFDEDEINKHSIYSESKC